MSKWLTPSADDPYCVNCGRTYDMHVVGTEDCPVAACFVCGGDGWLEGKDYDDGSSATCRPCPNCNHGGYQP